MQFDVFEKLSELETKIHLQKEELQKKENKIQHLTDQNNFLLNQLEINMTEIAALRRSQSSEIVRTREQEVQTECNVVVAEPKVVNSAFAGSEASIADILKQTSEAVISNTGYVFDEQTGLYFDKNSGYYYDSENQLFFEPRSGIYYTYNSETQEYSYHSSVSSELSDKFKALLEKWSRDGNQKISMQVMITVLTAANLQPLLCHLFGKIYRLNESYRHLGDRHHQMNDIVLADGICDQTLYHRKRRQVIVIIVVEVLGNVTIPVIGGVVTIEEDRVQGHTPGARIPEAALRGIGLGGGEVGTVIVAHLLHLDVTVADIDIKVRKEIHAPIGKPNGACIAATPVVYPPSVRLTVLGSGPGGPAVGSVGVLTSRDASRGLGCLGRDNRFCQHIFDLTHDLELDEIHCEITFNELDQTYLLMDKKALNGTFLNGNKLERGEKKAIKHGDVLRIGSNKLLIHIHPGRETCGQCDSSEIKAAIESGAIFAAASASAEKQSLSPKDASITVKNDTVKAKYGFRKNKLAKRYSRPALGPVVRFEKNRRSGPRQRTDTVPNDQSQYQDRAAIRRARDKATSANAQAIGATAAAQTGSGFCSAGGASVLTPIDESNVGARLLSKMGWNKGEGLGREKGGIAEPISASMRLDHRAGLGFGANAIPIDSTPSELRQARALSVTQERYRQIEERERQGQQ
ncbi:hypothetical protein ACTXT7_009906 [Hymenolepis weldensis]